MLFVRGVCSQTSLLQQHIHNHVPRKIGLLLLSAILIISIIHILQQHFFVALPRYSMPRSEDQSHSASLSMWTKSKLGALYETSPTLSNDEATVRKLYDSAFSNDVTIYLNHNKVERDMHLQGLHSAKQAVASAKIDWKEMFEVPPEDKERKGGIVAGFFVVTRSLKFRIRAGPAQHLVYNSFSAKVEHKPDTDPDSDGSRLRITELLLTSFEKSAPIHIHPIPQTN